MVYYERPGEIELPQLISRGISVDDMVRHWLFATEYQWEQLLGGDPVAKGITVLDIEKVGMYDLAGDSLTFLKRTIAFANHHYPERSLVIYIVNAPGFFSFIYRMVKSLIHENTQKKIRILSKRDTLAGLQEHIDISQIPEYYGGQLRYGPEPTDPSKDNKDSCRFYSPDVIAMNEFVKNINERNQQKTAGSQLSSTSSAAALPTSCSSSSADSAPHAAATQPHGVTNRPFATPPRPAFHRPTEDDPDTESTGEVWSITSSAPDSTRK